MNIKIPGFINLFLNSCASILILFLGQIFIKALLLLIIAKSYDANLMVIKGNFDLDIPVTSWTTDLVMIFYSSPTIISILLTSLLFLLLPTLQSCNSCTRLWLLWSFYICWTDFCYSIFSGGLTKDGFGYVFQYLYLSETFNLILTLLSLFIVPLAALITGNHILELQRAYFPNLHYGNNKKFILSTLILPSITTSSLLLMLQSDFTVTNSLSILFLPITVIPFLFARSDYIPPYEKTIKDETISNHKAFSAVILSLLIYVALIENDLKL